MHDVKKLKDGLKIGEEVLKTFSLKELSAGDLLDAMAESEKVVQTANGTEILCSPTLLSAHTARRMFKTIGDRSGPLTMQEIRAMSATDFTIVEQAIAELESAAAGAINRGRAGASS